MGAPSWIGQTLGGRYQIQELVGQGGMSAVYKAMDPNLRRVVAIKMIHSHLSDNPEFIRRFEEEATSVAQLRHPNIVQVFDFNHDGAVYYMVMEFVPGETLQARLRRLNASARRMEPGEAIHVALNVCDAASYAHQRGMIHRDIKPANIMLDVYGQAILTDFGIAKILGGERHTATGAVVGTALYMSPEQIQGKSPDERADIYSLGVTLFEMLSGRPPFESDSAMTLMMMHLNDPLPDLRALQPGTPEELVAVVEKALAKNREARFQSAAEMSSALHSALSHLEEGAAQPDVSPGALAGATQIDELPDDRPAPEWKQQSQGTWIDPSSQEHREPPDWPASSPAPDRRLPGSAGQAGIGAAASRGTAPGSAPASRASSTGRIQPGELLSETPSGGAAPPGSPPGRPDSAGPAPAAPRRSNFRTFAIGGILLALLAAACLITGGVYAYNAFFKNGGSSTPVVLASPGAGGEDTPVVLVLSATPSPTPTSQPSDTPTPTTSPPTETPLPTDTPPPSLTPTVTVPPGVLYVRIDGITIQDGRYVVAYETFEYTEKLPGRHVHFFFNTVPPDQAGVPGKGPWILYGGPRPFTGYKVSDRPGAATQMCALVANRDHSVQPNSGNCFDLPNS